MVYPLLWMALWRNFMIPAGIVAALVAVVAFGGRFGYLRAAVAVLMFVTIMFLGIRHLRKVTTLVPDPEITDVGDFGLKYVCTVCGLELKVEKAARDKAPSHCMEPMVLMREEGSPPPLHSV